MIRGFLLVLQYIVSAGQIDGLLLLVWFVVVVVVDVQPGLSVHKHCRPAPGSYDPGPALGEGKYQVSALNFPDSRPLVIGQCVEGLSGGKGEVWQGDRVQRGQGEVLGSGPCLGSTLLCSHRDPSH